MSERERVWGVKRLRLIVRVLLLISSWLLSSSNLPSLQWECGPQVSLCMLILEQGASLPKDCIDHGLCRKVRNFLFWVCNQYRPRYRTILTMEQDPYRICRPQDIYCLCWFTSKYYRKVCSSTRTATIAAASTTVRHADRSTPSRSCYLCLLLANPWEIKYFNGSGSTFRYSSRNSLYYVRCNAHSFVESHTEAAIIVVFIVFVCYRYLCCGRRREDRLCNSFIDERHMDRVITVAALNSTNSWSRRIRGCGRTLG